MSPTDEQFAFYRSQPVSYRRDWWLWARDQPNLREMLLTFDEKDESVIRCMEIARMFLK